MKFIDFFAGIGGFRRGMEIAGHECVGFCEWDKYAAASYTAMHLATPEQLEYLATLPKNKRVKEILKDEYRRNEWFSNDVRSVNAGNVPRADCFTFGAPCQDFSIAGQRKGLEGNRSALVNEIFRIVEEIDEEARPEWLIYENVKGMLSSNGGWDYAAILHRLDELGYDAEWQLFNSKYYVPQNRERIYTIGHYRKYGSRKILRFESNSDAIIKQRERPETFARGIVCGYGHDPKLNDISVTIGAFQAKGTTNHPMQFICVPCLTPERTEKRQNGRRYKENEDEMFSLTTLDRHGVIISGDPADNAVFWEKYNAYVRIRRLTPRECFRLQGWNDEYFDRAELVNSDSQLYKQAGNGVTVPVVYDIARRL